MPAMKISLDAAMRARDVSSSWRDDAPPDRNETEESVSVDCEATEADSGAHDPADQRAER